MNVITPVGERVTAPYRVGNFDRGGSSGVLSAQWRSRPDDQRFLSLDDLMASVKARADRSWAKPLVTNELDVLSSRDDHDFLALRDQEGRILQPTNWAFGQFCSLIGAPAGHYRKLPGPIAAIPIQYLAKTHREEMVKFFGTDGEASDVRAVTSPTYGRVFDFEVVQAVQSVIDETWKVPGVLNWGQMMYDPNHPVSKDTTTLYASDRDVFIMLVRDEYPVEVGKLPTGEPDLMFPGFIVSNSEVGAGSLYGEFMWMRAVCANRCIWGSQGYRSFRIIHRENAPLNFERARVDQMYAFTRQSAQGLVGAVSAAKSATIATTDEGRTDFLTEKLDFSKKMANDILETAMREDGHPAESAWDFVNAITATARSIPYQDERLKVERIAGNLLARAAT